jgi:hypothetical protein
LAGEEGSGGGWKRGSDCEREMVATEGERPRKKKIQNQGGAAALFVFAEWGRPAGLKEMGF